MNNGNNKHKTTLKEVTVFDIKDRLKALIFFAIIIMILEKIAQFFAEM